MKQMPYSELDRQILKDLFIMSTSRYSEVSDSDKIVCSFIMNRGSWRRSHCLMKILINVDPMLVVVKATIKHEKLKDEFILLILLFDILELQIYVSYSCSNNKHDVLF